MKRIYDVSKDTFMKCDNGDILMVKVPLRYSYYEMENLLNAIKKQTSNENILVIPEDININCLSIVQLQQLIEQIESFIVAKTMEQ